MSGRVYLVTGPASTRLIKANTPAQAVAATEPVT